MNLTMILVAILVLQLLFYTGALFTDDTCFRKNWHYAMYLVGFAFMVAETVALTYYILG